MKKFTLAPLFMVLSFAVFAGAQCVAPCLFYSGDFNSNNPDANALYNGTDSGVSGNPYGAATYENFVVSGNWHVTGLYTNNLSTYAPINAYWEIRRGVSEGNGGTLVASGTGTGNNFTWSPTGRGAFGFREYQALVSGLNFTLGAGTYWEAVVPTNLGNAADFNSNTFGLNQVGSNILNEQFFNSSYFQAQYTNANHIGVVPAFSAGVVGTQVPEPSSMILLGSGLVAAAGVVRRRLSR